MTVKDILSVCKNDFEYFNITLVNSDREESDIMGFEIVERMEKFLNCEVIDFKIIEANECLDFSEIYFRVKNSFTCWEDTIS